MVRTPFPSLPPPRRSTVSSSARGIWASCGWAGEPIAFDQAHRRSLEIKDLFEQILAHRRAVEAGALPRLRAYALHFWGNRGPYNTQNREKLRPDFSFDELRTAAQAARLDGGFAGADEAALDARLESLRRILFDPSYEPMLVDTSPGKDNVASSAVNFYEGVTQQEAEQSNEGKPYPIASRLSKENGVLREEAYRAGDPERGIPPGRYARELSAVIGHLREALPYASGPRQKLALEKLIGFFKSGDAADFKEYNRAWTHDDSPVDAILGFIETYNDPLGRRPSFEGLISFKDPKFTSVMQAVAAESDYFEGKAPWDGAYKKETSVPITANAVTMVANTGDAGAKLTAGVNLPNDQDLRQVEGSKNIMIANAISAVDGAQGAKEIEEFAWDAREIELHKNWRAASYRLHVSLHETVGHASGKVSDRVAGQDPAAFLREYFGALEEARAELFGLWAIADPRLVEKGLVESPEVVEQSYRSFVRAAFVQLKNYPRGDKLTQAHVRARNLIVNFLIEKGAVQVKERGGKLYLHVADL